jgi:exonuclease III
VVTSKIDVVCHQETKMEDVSHFTVIHMLGQDFSNYLFLPSVGASGEILIDYRNRLACLENFRIDSHSISVQFSQAGGIAWCLTCVYGPQGTYAKIKFLQELRMICQNCHGPWLIRGDFNLICSEEDKNNQKLDRAMMGRFRRWINVLSLKEILLHGHQYT